jgi:uncharacterized membrane protein YcaP (DUF421 family)
VQIITVACLHFLTAAVKQRLRTFGLLVDGTPIVLLKNRQWQDESVMGMRIADDDVMAAARDTSLLTLDQIQHAVLERNGEISVIPLEQFC